MTKDGKHPFILHSNTGDVEPSRLEEPLQSEHALILKGVLNASMTEQEVQDAASAALEFGQASENDHSTAFVRARSVLLLADVITDLSLLDHSPSVLDTSKGAMARVISSVHMVTLREAFEIEELDPTSENSEKIFAYRKDSAAAINSNPKANAVRILNELKKTGEISDREMDVLRRTVGYVIHKHLERKNKATAKK